MAYIVNMQIYISSEKDEMKKKRQNAVLVFSP